MNISPTAIRTAATVVVTGLTAAFGYYPHQLWIPAVIAAVSVLGVNVVPSIGQQPVSVPPTVSGSTVRVVTDPPGTLTVHPPEDPPTGAQLMGLGKP